MANWYGKKAVGAAAALAQRRGRGLSSAYETGMMGFDPQEYMRQSAAAGMSSLGEEYGQLETARNTGLARRGLFGSNIGGAQGGRDLNERIARMLGSLSMQAGGMEMDRLGSLGAAGETATGRYTDLMMSERDRKAAERASRRAMWGQIGGAALGAAGSALGG